MLERRRHKCHHSCNVSREVRGPSHGPHVTTQQAPHRGKNKCQPGAGAQTVHHKRTQLWNSLKPQMWCARYCSAVVRCHRSASTAQRLLSQPSFLQPGTTSAWPSDLDCLYHCGWDLMHSALDYWPVVGSSQHILRPLLPKHTLPGTDLQETHPTAQHPPKPHQHCAWSDPLHKPNLLRISGPLHICTHTTNAI